MRALVIDQDAAQRRAVAGVLRGHGWEVSEAASFEEATRVLARRRPALVFCDAQAETDNGRYEDMALVGKLRKCLDASAHVVITAAAEAFCTPAAAILNGASDFMRKPCDEQRIAECSRRVLGRLRAAEREIFDAHLAARCAASDGSTAVCELIGESEAMIGVFRELARILNGLRADVQAAEHDKDVASSLPTLPLPTFFITGETGTGKELVARTIHRHGTQRDGPFIPVNCGALPAELAEAELFGHAGGAFTGAGREKPGLWETASGGTLFLDEITEAPSAVQPKLLRVLQDGLVRRLGSNYFVETNVQVIAASNRDMEAEVRAGRFRRDLYHRLNLHRLHLPPLRERLEDLPLIVEHFSRHFGKRVRFSQEALDTLAAYSYPGNVRELENIVRGAARKSPDGVVYAVDLDANAQISETSPGMHRGELELVTARAGAAPLAASHAGPSEGLDEQVRRFKVRVVRETLTRFDGNVTRAAHALKVSRSGLYRLIRGLEANDKLRHDAERELNIGQQMNTHVYSARVG